MGVAFEAGEEGGRQIIKEDQALHLLVQQAHRLADHRAGGHDQLLVVHPQVQNIHELLPHALDHR